MPFTDAELLALSRGPVPRRWTPVPGAFRVCTVRNKALHSRLITPSTSGECVYYVRADAKIANAITSLKVYFPNFVHNGASTGEQANTGNTLVIDEAAIEYAGAFYNLKFSGGNTTTLTDGAYNVYSDTVSSANLLSTFGKSQFDVGDQVWIRVRLHTQNNLNTDHMPVGRAVHAELSGTQSFWAGTADTGTAYGVGVITPSTTPRNLGYMYVPSIFGTVVADTFAPMGLGDSICEGVGIYNTVQAGDFHIGLTYTIATAGTTSFTAIGAANNTAGTVFTATGAGSGTGTALSLDGAGSYSFLQRAMFDSGGASYPYMEVAASGGGSGDFYSSATKWRELLQYCNCVVMEHVQNDGITFAEYAIQCAFVALIQDTYGIPVMRLAHGLRDAADNDVKLAQPVLQSMRRNRRADFWGDWESTRKSPLESNSLADYCLQAAGSGYLIDTTHQTIAGAVAVGAALKTDIQLAAAVFA